MSSTPSFLLNSDWLGTLCVLLGACFPIGMVGHIPWWRWGPSLTQVVVAFISGATIKGKWALISVVELRALSCELHWQFCSRCSQKGTCLGLVRRWNREVHAPSVIQKPPSNLMFPSGEHSGSGESRDQLMLIVFSLHEWMVCNTPGSFIGHTSADLLASFNQSLGWWPNVTI